MNQIKIQASSARAVISALASAWGVEADDDHGEYAVHLPEAVGTGMIRGVSFYRGVGLLRFDCTFRHDIRLVFAGHEQPLKFINCEEGCLRHYLSDTHSAPDTELHLHENAIVSPSGVYGHRFHFTGGMKSKFNSLEVNRKEFMSSGFFALKGLSAPLKEAFEDTGGSTLFVHRGLYSIDIDDMYASIDSFAGTGMARYMYLKGKAYEILASHILLYEDDRKDEGKQKLLRKRDADSIHRAAALIAADLETRYSVEELAREVGLNPNKLQEGFRKLKGMTVLEYIRDLKLIGARQMLVSGDLDIGEIVIALGYTNAGYFAQIFGEKYGITPTEMRKRYHHRYTLHGRENANAVNGPS